MRWCNCWQILNISILPTNQIENREEKITWKWTVKSELWLLTSVTIDRHCWPAFYIKINQIKSKKSIRYRLSNGFVEWKKAEVCAQIALCLSSCEATDECCKCIFININYVFNVGAVSKRNEAYIRSNKCYRSIFELRLFVLKIFDRKKQILRQSAIKMNSTWFVARRDWRLFFITVFMPVDAQYN